MTVPRRLRPLAALLLATPAARAQEGGIPREVGSSANAWLDVATDVWVTPDLAVQLGGKVQRAELGAAPQQAEIRLGLQRAVGRRVRVAAGGLLAHNSPYGPFPAAGPSNERRLWQHLLLDQRVGRVTLQHRARLEERWIERPQPLVDGVATDPDISFGLRARYRLQATTPLGSGTGAHAPYVAVYDELLKSVGPHASTSLIDQNRAYAGVGVRWSPAVRTELGYVEQRILRRNGRQLEHGHTLSLTLAFTRPAPRPP